MKEENLEQRCRQAVIDIATDVKDIRRSIKDVDQKMSHFLDNYRHDYYNTMEAVEYRRKIGG